MYVYIYIYICAHIYVYIHVYMHIYIYLYNQSYKQSWVYYHTMGYHVYITRISWGYKQQTWDSVKVWFSIWALYDSWKFNIVMAAQRPFPSIFYRQVIKANVQVSKAMLLKGIADLRIKPTTIGTYVYIYIYIHSYMYIYIHIYIYIFVCVLPPGNFTQQKITILNG